MKKIALYTLGIAFSVLLFSSCNASKKGCGLTSDAQKMETAVNQQSNLVAQTE